MTARSVEQAGARLQELRQDEWSDLGLAGAAMGLALAASALHPPLALPLLAGAFVLLVLGLRALIQRCELFDSLLLDQDAYSISEVRRRAAKAASMKCRREHAAALRRRLSPLPGYPIRPRVAVVSSDLAALASELDDETLELDPWCAVRCEQLVTSVPDSPLLNDALPVEDLLARINQIRAGFRKKER
ncbi:MAG TPA: hypothetical protein VH760_01775 [Gaiellaceae bacterium]|jgi:hypothetical protein